MNSTVRTILFWLLMILLAVVLWKMASTGGQSAHEDEPQYTNFLDKVHGGKVKDVTIYLSQNSAELQGEYRNGTKFRGVTVANTAIPDLTKALQDQHIIYNYKEVKDANWISFMINFAPLILLVAFWIFMMKQMQAGGNKALSFGKSRARLLTAQQKKATFKDVAGIDEAKEELYEIIDFLKDPQKFQKLGGRIPKGVLLVGPPGTGKTLLARAIAGEANVPFFSISGSDFVEMFVGVGASRVRDLFEQGKKNAPCIIFIDEIDAVGRHRGAGSRRRPRRARADSERAARRNGRLRIERRRDPDCRHEPSRRSRSGASAPWPFRSARSRSSSGREGPRGNSARSHAQGASWRRCGSFRDRARHAGILRRGRRESGERVRSVGRAPEPQVRHDGRLRDVQGQSPDGRRAASR